jgi:hypothetical protein
MQNISWQLSTARVKYATAREALSWETKKWNAAKKWLGVDAETTVMHRHAVTRTLRVVNFARRRLLEAIRNAERELCLPKRQFFRPKAQRRPVLDRFVVTGVAA